MRKQLEKRNITVKKVNRKSGVFIADSFLKFHLAQNVMFYLVLFTVPSVSVIDCIEGHSILSYFAIAAFMLFVFVVDVVNLRYHINKELLKLELKNYHGKHKMRTKLFDQLFIYCTALCELFLTQLNLFDLYSDFAFLTIAHSQKDLGTFFVLSMTSFVMIMVPKVLSFWLVLKILCMSSNQKKHGMLASSAYYEDLRRKMIFRAFTFSEFRSQALCVDYINYEIYKTEFLMACVKFGIEDLPQFIIQTLYLLTTTCGVKNSNTIVYMSVCSTVLSSYWGFLYRLSLYLYKRKRLHAYERKVEISISSDTLENYGFKHVRRMLPYNNHLQSFLLSGSSHEYFYCNERRLQKTESMIKTMPVQRIAFFELDRCNFNFPYEPQILFNFLRNQVIFSNLRYLSIQRCKFCKGFLTPALTNFLNEDNNLIRFSFVHNNQDSLIKNNEEDVAEPGKRRSKASVRLSQLVEQEISQAGFLTDFQIMQVLDAATLHPKLEIIQIA